MDKLLVALTALVVIAVLVAASRALVRWSGVPRLVAILVGLATIAHAVKVVIDVRREPDSHNLWPFETLLVGGSALVILGVAALARARSARRG